MNKTKITLLLIIALLVSVAVACEKSPEKKKAAEIPVVSSVVKPWAPTAFSLDTDRLPPDYSGLDPIKFYEMFKSKVKNIKEKDQYETAKEFAKRTANKDLLLSPINTSDLYAFRIPFFYEYDADIQAYRFEERFKHSCEEAYSTNWVTCKVAPIQEERDTYVGSNAFGAGSRTVNRTRGHDFAVAIAKSSVAFRAAFSPDRELSWYYKFRFKIPIPLEKARNLKGMLAFLFIGRVTDAKIIKGRTNILKPKIDDAMPMDIFITEDAVPFEIKKIVFYVVQTGEILWQRAY